jgi:hypothetical protein
VRLRLLLLAFVSLFSCWPIWARPEASFIDWQELGSYRIARTETTVAQFRRYAQATGNLTLAERSDGGSEYVSGWTKRSGWNWRTPFGGAQPHMTPNLRCTSLTTKRRRFASTERLAIEEQWKPFPISIHLRQLAMLFDEPRTEEAPALDLLQPVGRFARPPTRQGGTTFAARHE